MKSVRFYTYLFAFLFLSAGCTPLKNSHFSEFLSLKYEVPECNTTYTYNSTTTLFGTAKFIKRGVNLVTQFETVSGAQVLKLKNMTQGDPLAEPLPIKFAEIAVYNAQNEIVQCGKTNASGDLKGMDASSNLLIPAKAGKYTVRVLARINHGLSRVTVNTVIKQDKYTNEVYYISTVANSNAVDDSNVTLTAFARQTDSLGVEGGAFNILNSIFTSYEFLNANVSTDPISCLNNKFNVFWKLGFNPAQYVYPDKQPGLLPTSTFYDQNIQSLFIAGGKLGNFSFEAAAHFDDYVIIHELAHHIENVCGSLITPGGSHYIITRTDPRLAWAEGWANYFAAQVMHDSIIKINPEFSPKMAATGITDTNWTYLFASEGFSDSLQNIGSGSGFMFDLKKPGNNPDSWQVGSYIGQPFDKVDPTRFPGEGHFREGAITRGIFKLANNCGSNCISGPRIFFDKIWQAMDKIRGIGQSNFTFKSSADFMERLRQIVTPGLWAPYKTFNELATSEALHLFKDGAFTAASVNKWVPYGTYLTNFTAGACAAGTFHIEPRVDDPVLTGTNSDQRYSNHFYTVDFSLLAGLDEISVTFIPNGGTPTEFDILLFEEGYLFNGDYLCPSFASDGTTCTTSYVASRSTNANVVKSDRRSGSISTKVIRDLRLLNPNKRYLLNIRAYTANKSINSTTDYTYQIRNQNGDNICPAP